MVEIKTFKLFHRYPRSVERKVNVTWHGNSSVSYRRAKFWYFEPELSVGPLSDKVSDNRDFQLDKIEFQSAWRLQPL